MVYLIEPMQVTLEGCKHKCQTLCFVKPMYGVPVPCDVFTL